MTGGEECAALSPSAICDSAAAEDLRTSSPTAEFSPAPSAAAASTACTPPTAFAPSACGGVSPSSAGLQSQSRCLDEGAQLLQQYRTHCFDATQWTAEVCGFFVAALRGARSAVCCAQFRQFVLWRALWRMHTAQSGLRAMMNDGQLLTDLIDKLRVDEDEQVQLRKLHTDRSRIAPLVTCADDEMFWLLLMVSHPAHFSMQKLRELASPVVRATWKTLSTEQRHTLWVALMAHRSAVDLLGAIARLGRFHAPSASVGSRAYSLLIRCCGCSLQCP
jgi:hypothetical protein